MDPNLRFALEYIAFIAVFAPLVTVIVLSLIGLAKSDMDDLD